MKNILSSIIITSFFISLQGWAGSATAAMNSFASVDEVYKAILSSSKVTEKSLLTGKVLTIKQIAADSSKFKLLTPSDSTLQVHKLVISDSLKSSVVFVKSESDLNFAAVHLRRSDIEMRIRDMGEKKLLVPKETEYKGIRVEYDLVDGKKIPILRDEVVQKYTFSTGDSHTVTTTHIWDLKGNLKEVRTLRQDKNNSIRESFALSVEEAAGKTQVHMTQMGLQAIGKTAHFDLATGEKVIYAASSPSKVTLVTKNSKTGGVAERLVPLSSSRPKGALPRAAEVQ